MALIAVVYGGLLALSVTAYVTAGARAEAFRAMVPAAVEGFPKPLFLADEPDFVRHERGPWAGVPIAQIFHWGLADAFMPPFADDDLEVYPLPRLSDGALSPLAALGTGTLLRVAGDDGLRPIVRAPTMIPVLSFDAASELGDHAFRVGGLDAADRARAVIVARGHPDLVPVTATRDPARNEAVVTLPETVIDTMQRRWGGAIYVWVEARDSKRQLGKTSRALTVGAPGRQASIVDACTDR